MQQTIELKLLKVINTLVVCGSVKTTAKLLNLSPAAISYSLKKLRDITGEHLFIRTRNGMKPNATAYELSQRYQKYFASEFESSGQENQQDEKTLTIMTHSPVEMLLSKSIFELNHKQHNYRYIYLPFTTSSSERLDNLLNNIAYIDIGTELPQDPAFSKVKLFTSDISILASTSNTIITETLTSNDLYQLSHAAWSSSADYYCENMQTSSEVKKYMQDRDVAIVSGSIINMVEFCSRSDCIMLIPDVFVPMFINTFPVKCHKLPTELKMKHDCYMHFNNKLTESPTIISLIDNIIHSVRTTFTDRSS